MAAAMLGFGALSLATTDDVAVIVHKSNPVMGMTLAQLRAILLGAGSKWSSGHRITAVLTPAGRPERSGTLRVVCGMSETDFNLSFIHGWRNPDGSINGAAEHPAVRDTGLSVRQSVATTPYEIGFIKASEVDDSVKVITVEGRRPGEQDYKLRF
jgi:ABC-type phosphate transport system substrate-binding protein